MSHQIETHGSRAAALFARTDPWHRLGTTVTGQAFDALTAMTMGHLGGWDVRKAPVTATEITDHGVTTIEVPGQFATLRTTPSPGPPRPSGSSGPGTRPCRTRSTPSS